LPETAFPTYEYNIKINTTETLLRVIEYLELTLEKCKSSIIIWLAKEFSITAYRVRYHVHKTSLRGPAYIRLSLFYTLKMHSITAVLNINFPVTIMSPN
jgi:hypothetical protein